MGRIHCAVLSVAVAAFAAGCASNSGEPQSQATTASAVDPWSGVTDAVAVVHSLGKANAHGTVHFMQVDGGVRVSADIEGLKPNSRHAFHLHEFGDCSSADGKSAGGHYNPDNAAHGGPDAEMHHAGDLGNLQADAKGAAHYERVIVGITVAGDQHPILGRSVIIHAGEDDLTTQPTGTTGDGSVRIACGVIGVAKPAAK